MITEEIEFTPPHSLETEQALLGAILVNNDILLRIDPNLVEGDFYEPVHGRIFDACSRMIALGKPADPVNLKPFFDGDEALHDIGGAKYLVRLCGSTPSTINAPEYAQAIINDADRRKIILLAEDIKERALTPSFEGSRETQSFIEETLASLRNERHKDGKLFSAAESVAALDAEIQESITSGFDIGFRCGISKIDALIGGFRKGHLVIIGARPAMGKTALLLEMMRGMAQLGHGCLIHSIEMGADELAERMISSVTATTTTHIEYDSLSNVRDMEFSKIRHWESCQKVIEALPFYIKTGKTTISSIRRAAKATDAKLRAQGKRLDIIFVDYLQKMRGSHSAQRKSRYEEITEISGDLKDLAEELDVCLIVAAQLNRDLEKRDNKTPQPSDLRDSGSLEQDANVIIFPYREEVYIAKEENRYKDFSEWEEKMQSVQGKMKFILAKKRRGKIGSAILNADMGCNHITD